MSSLRGLTLQQASETPDRWLKLPDWLVEQLAARAADEGAEGYGTGSVNYVLTARTNTAT
jgi:hypothetical protein